MSHSHLAVRHLIRKVEEQGRPREGRLPDRLVRFVHEIAELFEPFNGAARPGYECLWEDDHWEVAIFLGKSQLVGGAWDGAEVPVNFRFDLRRLMDAFDELHTCRWNAFPDACSERDDLIDLSFVSAAGTVHDTAVSVQVRAHPPEETEPVTRQEIPV